MPHDRFWYDGALRKGEECLLTGEESRHLSQVMRKAEGATVELINGKGVLGVASIVHVDKKGCRLHIDELHSEAVLQPRITLMQAMPRLNRLDYIIEKGVELGVDAFMLFEGERSERSSLSENQWQRLQHIAIAAMKQCGRLTMPLIKLIDPIKKWLPAQGVSFFGDLRCGVPKLAEQIATIPLADEYTFCIGPEGGFSEHEVAQLDRLGYQGVGLHHNILRTDTAPLVAVVLLSHLLRPGLLPS